MARTFADGADALYHGTIRTFAERIVKDGIDVHINDGAELDFGNGFYFSDKVTASRLARLKAKEREEVGSPGEDRSPVVIKLNVDIKSLRQLRCVLFTRKDFKWFEFVFNMRCYRKEHGYDYIEGPMADGAIDSVMKQYRRRPGAILKFIVWLNYMGVTGLGHIQYVVKTDAAIDCVRILDVEEVRI